MQMGRKRLLGSSLPRPLRRQFWSSSISSVAGFSPIVGIADPRNRSACFCRFGCYNVGFSIGVSRSAFLYLQRRWLHGVC